MRATAKEAISTNTTITYEQPVTEYTRLYLRLEFLFSQLEQTIGQTTVDSSKMAMDHILKLINVTDRPDIKSKLTQTLTQQSSHLKQLQKIPEVNAEALNHLLSEIDNHIQTLHKNLSRVGDGIRKNEFLSQIRSQLHNPAGACRHTAPAFYLWLRKPPEERNKDLTEWLSELNDLKQCISLVLKLIRESTPMQEVSCQKGFFQQTLDSNQSIELLRITLPIQYNLYPEFSVSKHRVNIRFLHPTYYDIGRSEQSHKNFHFMLACCKL